MSHVTHYMTCWLVRPSCLVKKIEKRNHKIKIVFSIALRKRERKMKKAPFFFSSIYLTKVYISKLSFIISLFAKINKNPSLIIYVDLKITTIEKKYRVYSIEYRVKKEKKRYKKSSILFLSNYPTKVYTKRPVMAVLIVS